LDELGKVVIKKKHLGTLSSLSAFIGFTKEYEKHHEKILQAVNNMENLGELKAKHTPCPPMEEVNKRIAKFISLAKKMKEKGRVVLEDHLM
jgi:ppGpp synthetase/RelA/SpoT-type nucleotidyltranferase